MFLDTDQFDFIRELESRWEAIRAEYLALSNDLFDPWVQREIHGGGWTVYGLFGLGQPIPGATEACPNTAEAIGQIPGLTLAGFSRLAPQTRIFPHVGYSSSVYRVHLGLVVPEGCRIRVGQVTREWQEGKCLVFDDTLEHETWNDSEHTRGVLLLDFQRPGLQTTGQESVPEIVKQYAATLFKEASLDANVAATPDRAARLVSGSS